jgi:hypothetical protein
LALDKLDVKGDSEGGFDNVLPSDLDHRLVAFLVGPRGSELKEDSVVQKALVNFVAVPCFYFFLFVLRGSVRVPKDFGLAFGKVESQMVLAEN